MLAPTPGLLAPPGRGYHTPHPPLMTPASLQEKEEGTGNLGCPWESWIGCLAKAGRNTWPSCLSLPSTGTTSPCLEMRLLTILVFQVTEQWGRRLAAEWLTQDLGTLSRLAFCALLGMEASGPA